MNLEDYFRPYREQIIGIDLEYAAHKMVYADWSASGDFVPQKKNVCALRLTDFNPLT